MNKYEILGVVGEGMLNFLWKNLFIVCNLYVFLLISLKDIDTIHLLHAGEGIMKIYSLESIIFPKGNTRGEYDTRGWINFHISWTRML